MNAQRGCQGCRSAEGHRFVTNELIAAGLVNKKKPQRVKCNTCGTQWDVQFFDDETGNLCVTFTPVGAAVLQ